MRVSAIHITVTQVIKTGMLERLGKTPCNSRTHKKIPLDRKFCFVVRSLTRL